MEIRILRSSRKIPAFALMVSLFMCWMFPAVPCRAKDISLRSPNERLQVTLGLHTVGSQAGVPLYSVARDGEQVVKESRLGFWVSSKDEQSTRWAEGLEVVSVQASESDSVWRPVYGERNTVRDRYRQVEVAFRQAGAEEPKLIIQMRAYDVGIAFCYRVPQIAGMNELRIKAEETEFRFSEDLDVWAVYSAQGAYEQTQVSQLRRGCERPLVMRNADGLYVCLAEARLVDFARMKLSPLKESKHALVTELSSPAICPLPFRSPWRVIMVTESPGELLEQNDLLLNLNDPCALADTSWIKPGKVIREVTLTTVGGKACVDFAVKQGLQYVEFDAGWYGHEYDEQSDATTVTVDPKRSPGPLDLLEVIRYAEERGIGIILYVNRRALEKQLPDVLPLFQKWGIKGVKYGFVNVGSQQWTAWLHKAIKSAADHRLMVDVHDEYRPTGVSRTYPNLMTQEGIRGDETSPSNELTLTILFTRMIAGAGDNTICYYNERVTENASHAYQLAKSVCLYSPWQFLFWYDRPVGSPGAKGGAGGGQGIIGTEPELDFFRHVPTVWDDTRVIHGEIGQYAVVARRDGRNWYVGAMNNDQPRTLPLPLKFLKANREYSAHIYRDDPSVRTRTHVRVEQLDVNRDSVLQIDLPARGGQALRLVPKR